MKTLGVTGGVGMGKSASAELLRARGIAAVHADELARQLVEPGQPALAEIREVFGAGVISPDGQLRRGELAKKVFADAAARAQLEGILDPRIRQLWQNQLQAWRGEGRSLAAVIIPLLFETDAQRELDVTLCVACSPQTQHQRLLARGWPSAHIQQRLEAQWPVEESSRWQISSSGPKPAWKSTPLKSTASCSTSAQLSRIHFCVHRCFSLVQLGL